MKMKEFGSPGGHPWLPLGSANVQRPPQWTDTCKNITLPQTLQAVVKEILVCREGYMKGGAMGMGVGVADSGVHVTW